MKTGTVLATAVASMMFAGIAQAKTAKKSSKAASVECTGINACKGQSACATANNACSGQNACKGKGMVKTTAKDCKAKGGAVVAKK